MAPAAETLQQRSRRRRRFWARTGRGAVPYGLIVPIVVVIAVVLGYPLFWLVKLSLQRYGLFDLIRHQGILTWFYRGKGLAVEGLVASQDFPVVLRLNGFFLVSGGSVRGGLGSTEKFR